MNWNKILDIRTGTYSSDFRLCNPFDNSRGDTYEGMQQSWTNLIQHESMFEILDTINHEAEHVALKRETMEIDIEHLILRKIHQITYGLIDLDD